MGELVGTVERIRYVSAETDWTVLDIRPDGQAWPSTVVGTLPAVAVGMRIRAFGDWVDDPKWGRQYKAEACVEVVPATPGGISAYLASGVVPGIGPKMAERIVKRFGAKTIEVIRSAPERLREVDGLGAKRVASLAESFKERHAAQESYVFLYGLGITAGLAKKIVGRYGDDTVALLKRDPYRLALDVHGIGFHRADRVAAGLEIDKAHPARLRAALVHVLLEAQGEGHCFMVRQGLLDAASALTGVDQLELREALQVLVMEGRAALEEWPHDPTEPAVYLVHLRDAEERAARHVALLAAAPVEVLDDEEVEARIEHATQVLGLELAEGQVEAVRMALRERIVVVTGGPGTGKTTIIRAILVAADLDAGKVAMAAPTGRAAKRMSEATGHPASTIHRLLEFQPTDGRFARGEDDPLEIELLIVDEASMVDLPLFDALVQALPLTARLVLVGDVDQLPPVGPGSPLADLIRSELVPVARLTAIFRQGEGSEIVLAAHGVNEGRQPSVTPSGTPLQDFYFIHRQELPDVLATIEELVCRRIPKRFGFEARRDIQVLAPMRAGAVGVNNLNARLQHILNPDGAAMVVGGTTFRVGDRVMQIRNDYDRSVFNGDVGHVLKVDPESGVLIASMDGRAVAYDKQKLEDLVLAYAVSVHKSQGSEYPAVVMPIVTQHFKMLQRNLIYTGITRGKQLVVLVGTPKAMGIAVRNQHVAERHGMLGERVRTALRELRGW